MNFTFGPSPSLCPLLCYLTTTLITKQHNPVTLKTPKPGRTPPAAGARLEARVVEAKVDRGLGPMATVVVRQGTLRSGDWLVAGTEYGRVRALLSASGAQLQQVTPGHHAQVSGLRGVPLAGDELAVVATEERARAISEGRRARAADFRRAQLAAALHEQQQQTIARLQVCCPLRDVTLILQYFL